MRGWNRHSIETNKISRIFIAIDSMDLWLRSFAVNGIGFESACRGFNRISTTMRTLFFLSPHHFTPIYLFTDITNAGVLITLALKCLDVDAFVNVFLFTAERI